MTVVLSLSPRLLASVKPSQPALTVVHSTVDSVVVSWTRISYGVCRLRYRVDNARTWSQVGVEDTQTLVYVTYEDIILNQC